MNFINFQKAIYNQANRIQKNDSLFTVRIDKDDFWNHYLASFPEGSNPIFRERTEHDCSCCRHFIKTLGNVIAIKDGKIESIWDVGEIKGEPEYTIVAKAMSKYIHDKMVDSFWFTHDSVIGTKQNHESTDDKGILTWDHFYADIDSKFVVPKSVSIPERVAELNSSAQVFKRALDEFSVDTIQTVLELIADNSLYRGAEWKKSLTDFKKILEEYKNAKNKDLFAWEKVIKNIHVSHIRNSSMGTLLIDIENEVDLAEAVRKYESVVAPWNYKRPKPVVTKKMIEDAQKTITELGYLNSLGRRMATLDDITVNNIIYCNRDVQTRLAKESNIFDALKKEVGTSPKAYDHVQEISIEKFVNDVIPTSTNIEVLFENRLKSNLMSVTAPLNKEAPSLFKWNNPYGWVYTGNITDSVLKENVKNAGGNVEGDLRFSIQWNDGSQWDRNDLDAHCRINDNYQHIYFSYKEAPHNNGGLDVDIIDPKEGVAAVENITFASKEKMDVGTYTFFVHCFSNRHGKSGFRAEIEFNGTIYSYDYPHELPDNKIVEVATVTLNKNGNFSIKEHLKSNQSRQQIWNLTTNEFIPVTVMMYSPNYWDEQKGIGNKHYFFLLKDCINDENPRGFFNEFLKPELEKHKRVFELLGSKTCVETIPNELSGLGFASTKHNHVIVKVTGESNTQRTLKVVF